MYLLWLMPGVQAHATSCAPVAGVNDLLIQLVLLEKGGYGTAYNKDGLRGLAEWC